MELREIVSFFHAARLRSVSKAAKKLELGQPTVTTHLRKLEDEFSITLFDRIKRPIQLTSEGHTFLELITPIVDSLDTLKNQMDYSEKRGSFLVGAYPDIAMYHLPAAIRSFRGQYPEVHIRLRARPFSALMQLVKSGEIDLALCTRPSGDDPLLEFQPLFQYNMVLMTPPNHPLLEIHPVQFEDIARWPLIHLGPESSTRHKIDQTLKEQGITCDFALEMDNTELIKRYVEIGMGVAMCSDFTLHPEDHDKLGVVRLNHLFTSSSIGVCTLKGKFLGRAVRNFMNTLSEDLTGYHVELWDWESTHKQLEEAEAVNQND